MKSRPQPVIQPRKPGCSLFSWHRVSPVRIRVFEDGRFICHLAIQEGRQIPMLDLLEL